MGLTIWHAEDYLSHEFGKRLFLLIKSALPDNIALTVTITQNESSHQVSAVLPAILSSLSTIPWNIWQEGKVRFGANAIKTTNTIQKAFIAVVPAVKSEFNWVWQETIYKGTVVFVCVCVVFF